MTIGDQGIEDPAILNQIDAVMESLFTQHWDLRGRPELADSVVFPYPRQADRAIGTRVLAFDGWYYRNPEHFVNRGLTTHADLSTNRIRSWTLRVVLRHWHSIQSQEQPLGAVVVPFGPYEPSHDIGDQNGLFKDLCGEACDMFAQFRQ
jgi:hypothetical protein